MVRKALAKIEFFKELMTDKINAGLYEYIVYASCPTRSVDIKPLNS